jgi:HAD superfamily hydrolase (TIGR01509 family)
MSLPEVVVFDLGKVLVDFDYSKAARRLAARTALSLDDVRRAIDQSHLHIGFETGHVTKEDFIADASKLIGFAGLADEFTQIFCEIFEPIQPMIELQSALRKRGIPTFIFSNTNALQLGYIRQTYPFFSGFDGYILSYEHGAMKPDAKLYEVVERETRRRGNQILYIDDRPENIATGAARGWQVILQETPEKTLAAFRQTGLAD